MTLHLKSRGYPFRPRLLFSCFIVVGVGFPNCVLFQERTVVSRALKGFGEHRSYRSHQSHRNGLTSNL